jgi:hypothetical protein
MIFDRVSATLTTALLRGDAPYGLAGTCQRRRRLDRTEYEVSKAFIRTTKARDILQ